MIWLVFNVISVFSSLLLWFFFNYNTSLLYGITPLHWLQKHSRLTTLVFFIHIHKSQLNLFDFFAVVIVPPTIVGKQKPIWTRPNKVWLFSIFLPYLERQYCYLESKKISLLLNQDLDLLPFYIELKAYWILISFSDVEALCLASDFRWFNPTSGTWSCNSLPSDLSRNNTQRHWIFQELCNISSSRSQSCDAELNSWLLPFSSTTGSLKQGFTTFFNAFTLLLSSVKTI